MTNVEKNQYIWSSRQLSLPEMTQYAIAGGWLYVHPGLKVTTAVNGSGGAVLLLGAAFPMDEPGKTPGDDISRWDGQSLLPLTRYWTGRWALFTEDSLCTDAGSMLSAFYCTKNGHRYISSSLALLLEIGATVKTRTEKIGETQWQILPETGFSGVKKLLCTEKIQFSPEDIRPVPHIWMQDRRQLTTGEKARALADLLVTGLDNISRQSGRKLLLALTGGKDSRLVLAAMLKAGVAFSAYTAQHDNISSADVKLPRKFAAKFGFSHVYIQRPRKMDPAMAADFDRFTAGNAQGEDKRFYSYGQFSRIPADAVVLRGGFFEAGQSYGRSIARADDHFAEDMAAYHPALKTDPLQKRGMEQWLANAEACPIPHVDIRDRFYVEQRVGGWGAAIEQALSINDFLSIQIANCSELLSLLLSCSPEERSRLALSYEPVGLLQDSLLREAFNPISWTDRCRRLLSALKSPLNAAKKWISKCRIRKP